LLARKKTGIHPVEEELGSATKEVDGAGGLRGSKAGLVRNDEKGKKKVV
jgi:hypothetical protein